MSQNFTRTITSLGFAPRSNRGISLLEAISATGSINQAASRLKISYKAAWEQVDMLNNLAETPLLSRSVGGRGGGGTQLTVAGQELVRHYRKIEKEYRKFIEFIDVDLANAAEQSRLLRRMEMKVSARNIWRGTVERISDGTVNTLVTLQISGGDQLVAAVTRESIENLELAVGSEALALVKSSAVLLARDLKPKQVSARNLLCGKVSHMLEGPVSTEVTLDLPGTNTVTATITRESAEQLELKIGLDACALIKASSLLLAIV